MRAAAIREPGGPDVLVVEELPDPEPRGDEVLVEVRAIGVQGGDLLARARGRLDVIPHVIGLQAAGVVRALGADVRHLRVGQHVVAFGWAGSHAELLVAPECQVWGLPDDLPFEAAAAVPVEYGTAHDALFEFGSLQDGETVLIQAAASGVGLSALHLAKDAGARVIGTASSPDRLAKLREMGLDVGVDYVHDDPVAAVLAATDGRGVDLVVDTVGGRTLERSIACLAQRGRVSWVGGAGRDPAPPDISGLQTTSGSMTGVFLGGEMRVGMARVHAIVTSLIARVARGELPVVIDSVYPLAEAAAAHRHIESRAAFGHVVLVP
jgi:NADPH2:quinone reductase